MERQETGNSLILGAFRPGAAAKLWFQDVQHSNTPVLHRSIPGSGTAVADIWTTVIGKTQNNMALIKVGVTKMSVPAKFNLRDK